MVAAASAGTLPWVHPVDTFPDAARAEVARRREQILARATGTIGDLDDPAVAARFVDAGRTTFAAAPAAADGPAGPRYDTVLATGVLSGFADLAAVTAALIACLADDGVFLFVEPVARPGWSSVVRTSLPDPRWRRAPWSGLHLDRDVPAAVRAAGLVVVDLDRGELPSQPPSLRHWVSGRAIRIAGH